MMNEKQIENVTTTTTASVVPRHGSHASKAATKVILSQKLVPKKTGTPGVLTPGKILTPGDQAPCNPKIVVVPGTQPKKIAPKAKAMAAPNPDASDSIATNWDRDVDSFEHMELSELLLRGIFAYGYERPRYDNLCVPYCTLYLGVYFSRFWSFSCYFFFIVFY
jgi:hypothetical protein